MHSKLHKQKTLYLIEICCQTWWLLNKKKRYLTCTYLQKRKKINQYLPTNTRYPHCISRKKDLKYFRVFFYCIFFRMMDLDNLIVATGLIHTILESIPQFLIQAGVVMIFAGIFYL